MYSIFYLLIINHRQGMPCLYNKIMNLSNNTILITGGGSGIGLALAERFIKAGSEVIICGRREAKLKEAKEKFPSIHTYVCDVANKSQREELCKWAVSNFPKLNILINNAGIQRQNNFLKGADMASASEEIETNLVSTIHLSALFIPHLLRKPDSSIINVSSGLGFIPIARMPVYCATKAAIHSFTLSLRHQLKSTSIKVYEIIPPTVDTELDHGTRPQSFRGMPLNEFADEAMKGLESDNIEVTVGMSKGLFGENRASREEAFARMNG